MEKQIKFRCWIPSYAEFIYWGFISGTFIGPPTGSNMSIEECLENSEQLTGLEDVDGQPIYVGDIIEYDVQFLKEGVSNGYQSYVSNKNTVKRLDEIVFRHGEFTPSHSQFGWEGEEIINCQYSKVVGNIHADPELYHKIPKI